MRITVRDIRAMKTRGEPIPMLTAYDTPTARLLDQAGVPILLVGDSVGMVVLGYEDTTRVTMADMIHHVQAVVRGSARACIVADMPFMSYTVSVERAVENAGRLIQEAGAQAVKLEGGTTVAEIIRRVVAAGIPVMGHVGLTPQQVLNFGGYRVQGRSLADAEAVLRDAIAVEAAGAFAIVLECIPSELAGLVTETLSIPTIGIGAGPACDGQVQVIHDLVGWLPDFTPKHAKRYAELGAAMRSAAEQYLADVRGKQFPGPEHGWSLDESVRRALKDRIAAIRAGQ